MTASLATLLPSPEAPMVPAAKPPVPRRAIGAVACAALLHPGSHTLPSASAPPRPLQELLAQLGVLFEVLPAGLRLDTLSVNPARVEAASCRAFQLSPLILGPLLARVGFARIWVGDAQGAGHISSAVEAFEALGASVSMRQRCLRLEAGPAGLVGAVHRFSERSVSATCSVMMAATLATGSTVLANVSTDPTVGRLADALRSMGAIVHGGSSHTLIIEGRRRLDPLGSNPTTAPNPLA